MFKRILIPIDLADPDMANRIIDVAETLPVASDGELHVLTVVPTYGMSIVGSYFDAEHEKRTVEAVRQGLEEHLSKRDSGRLTVKGHVAHGTIYDEIMRVANELSCDLIVLAAHRPELKDYLLGPNAARVVRHANCSVMVVRETD